MIINKQRWYNKKIQGATDISDLKTIVQDIKNKKYLGAVARVVAREDIGHRRADDDSPFHWQHIESLIAPVGNSQYRHTTHRMDHMGWDCPRPPLNKGPSGSPNCNAWALGSIAGPGPFIWPTINESGHLKIAQTRNRDMLNFIGCIRDIF